MTYCIEVWRCASQTQLNCLSLLQKKIIIIMNFSHYLAHTNPLFLSMEVLPLSRVCYLARARAMARVVLAQIEFARAICGSRKISPML